MSEQPVILITGASSGIGAATVRLFAGRGYRVALAARRIERLQELAGEIQAAGGDALPLAVDVSQLEQVQAMIASVLQYFGRLDVVFANAGFGRLDWLENLDPVQDVQAQIDVNLTGVIWTAQAALPHMLTRRSGHIILMSSVAGYAAPPTYSVYSATKYAVRAFGNALGREVKRKGVRVSTICPGPVHTEFGPIAFGKRKKRFDAPAWLSLSDIQVARAVFGLVRRPRRSLVVPGTMRIAAWVEVLAPGLVDWVAKWVF